MKIGFTGIDLVVVALALSTGSMLHAADPSRPEDLRVEVYSDTAAELFWTRSTDDGQVRGYEIRINGEVATVRDGSSYFTEALVEGVSYEVEVSAIDDEGNRSPSASVSFVGGDQGPGHADDEGPSRPANLRSATYSATAIELFWDRVPVVGLSYEVSIGGDVVATTRGVSYFTDALERGRRYAFDVVAIDASGNRSEASAILADTTGRPISIPPAGPPVPANVSILVYSRTAAELFWDRAPADANVVSTEVQRDGVVLGMAEGNSFFDDTREPGVRHVYGLTAIDGRNNRSITTELTEAPASTVINRDNYVDLLADALPAFSGENFTEGLNDTVTLILSDFVGTVASESPTFQTTHVCSNGGTALFEGSPLFIQFTDCQIGDTVVDGRFSYSPSNASTLASNGLSITTAPDTTLEFDGIVSVPGRDFYRATDVNVRLTSPTGSLSLAGVDTQFRFAIGVSFIAEFDGSFDFSSTATDGRMVAAATVTGFRYAEPPQTHTDDWNYRSGVLQLSAEDGSEVILNADTGEDSTVSIRLNSDAGVEELIQPWSLWQGLLRRAP